MFKQKERVEKMKIAIPSTGKDMNSLMSKTLGRSPFIVVYDSESKDLKSIENPGFQSQDGSGLKVVEKILHTNANVLLTKQIGRKAYSALQAEHFKIELLDSSGTIKSILNKYLKKHDINN